MAILVLWATLVSAQEQVVKLITVIGAKQVSQEAILLASGIRAGEKPNEEAVLAAQEAIERMGFFKRVAIERNADELVVRVQEWPVVEKVEISGNQAISSAELTKVLAIEVGKIFNSREMVARVKSVRDLYQRKGFFGDVLEVGFSIENPNTLAIQVLEMTVNSLVPYGNKRTRTDIIERLLFTKVGKPFNRNTWQSDIRRLHATNWFDDVKSFSHESSPGRLDLVPAVLEAKTGEWSAGLATEPGSPVVGTFSIAERNLMGTGQSLAFRGAQGLKTRGPSLEVEYGNPFLTANNLTLAASIYSRFSYRFAGLGLENGEDPIGEENLGERRVGATVGVAKALDTNTTAQAGLRIEDVKAAGSLSQGNPGIARQSGALASLIFGLTRNRRDSDVAPSKGDWFKLGVEPGFSRITQVGGSLKGTTGIGDHTFLKTTAEYRAYWGLDPSRTDEGLEKSSRIFALRVRYGSLLGNAPFSEQFFVGGTDSVRGYAQDRYWGSQMFVATLEYRHTLNRDLGIVGFVDYGGAWGGYGGLSDFTQSKRMNLHIGYGIGINYKVPRLGPLRIDFGADRSGRIRTHFQIATPF
ncbi:MAG: BamA/TamA family outer membrane protein [Chlorobia bacterium]|nr:BamA/TamA family outer membrane protein [Fimbriimonadaceae bacterium]